METGHGIYVRRTLGAMKHHTDALDLLRHESHPCCAPAPSTRSSWQCTRRRSILALAVLDSFHRAHSFTHFLPLSKAHPPLRGAVASCASLSFCFLALFNGLMKLATTYCFDPRLGSIVEGIVEDIFQGCLEEGEHKPVRICFAPWQRLDVIN